jgi:outer membrane protein assembly factor BamB
LWRADIARNMAMAGRYYGTPMVYKDKIYTLCPRGGNERQNITCYNRFTGELIWERIDFPDNIEGYQIIANNSTLVVFSVGNSFAAGYNLETGNQEFFTKFDSPLPFGASVHVVRGKIYSQAKYHILKIDLDAKKVTASYDGEFNGYIINDDLYVIIGSKIIRKDIETSRIKWSWETPLKDTMQSVYKMSFNEQPDGYSYNIFNYPFIVTNKYVFWVNAATRYHTGMKVSQVFNSLFILNKETGKLIKEVKFPANGFDNIMNPGSIYFSTPAARPSQYYP